MALSIDMRGDVAIVTGAGQRIGQAIAVTLAEAGAHVLVNDIEEDRARSTVELITGAGGTADPLCFDVTDLEAVRRAIDGLPRVDVLVNNAGNIGHATERPGDHFGSFKNADPSTWSRYVGVNLYGVLNCCYTVLPLMTDAHRGRIVTVISDAARTGEAGLAAYGAAKAGAAAFSRSIAKEVGQDGVTVNCVSLASIGDGRGDEHEVSRRYAIRRLGSFADVANAVAFLASNRAAWITGQTLSVNGGYSMFP